MGSPNAICDRCGFRRNLLDLRKEWTNLMVCAECLDPKPPYLTAPKVVPEGMPWPNARPEGPDVEVTANQVQPGDF